MILIADLFRVGQRAKEPEDKALYEYDATPMFELRWASRLERGTVKIVPDFFIFDLDGTLFDSHEQIIRVANATREAN